MAIAATAACHPSSRPALPANQQTGTAAARLQRDVEGILNDPALAHGTWGVQVESLTRGDTLFAWNSQKLLLPASNMKIVTLAAAAAGLGWSYTYETRLLARGTVGGSVLSGDLVVVGSGDPSIGGIDGSANRIFTAWAEQLKQRGITRVDGRVIGDDHAFEDQTLGFGWSWDDLPDDYAAGVGALQFNENAVRVRVSPGPAPGAAAGVAVDPPDSGIVVVNDVRTGAAGSAVSLSTHRLPGQQTLAIRGTIAAGAASPAVLTVSVDNPTLFFVQALRRSLISHGIDVRGAAVDIDDVADSVDTSGAAVVAVNRSAPLSALAVRLMKISQNQYAETFLKSLSVERDVAVGPPAREAKAERRPPPATALGGRAAAQKLLAGWGVDEGGLIIRDGSGLSRYDFLTTQTLVAILRHVHQDPTLYEPFAAALPTPGTDGTLGNRLKGTAAEGRVRAKTGSMSQVRALSGYVTTSDDEPLAFSIIANNFDTTADVVNHATDAIVIKLAEFRR